MARSPQRSLRHEYELYVEQEIEAYKDSLPRSALLKIGDEAVAALLSQPQFALTELVVWEEVDRIIKQRLRLPAYTTWRRRRVKILKEYQRPEHWGLSPDSALVREVKPMADTTVLVSGQDSERAALYLAAQGCEVYAVDQTRDIVERVVNAAQAAGLTERVHGYIADLRQWPPDILLNAVVCTSGSFDGLSAHERDAVIERLKGATSDGGIHLMDTSNADTPDVPVRELSAQYQGWAVSVDAGMHDGASPHFVARKGAA